MESTVKDFSIDLNKPITYLCSSFRFFNEGEYHVTRYTDYDVLLLVFEGTLRFTENGIPVEVTEGEYYIQRGHCRQGATAPSDAPKYLYVHFKGENTASSHCLKGRGNFSISKLMNIMEELDKAAHSDRPHIEQAALFYSILGKLYNTPEKDSKATKIAEYITEKYKLGLTLDDICENFHYSKNHVINIFKSEYGKTPIEYLCHVRIKKATYLIEVTSKGLNEISEECGFNNYSHFYRLFTRENGMSPEAYRIKSREKS